MENLKQSVHRKKKTKNTSILLTQDLTWYRQGLDQELSRAKRAGTIHSFGQVTVGFSCGEGAQIPNPI